MRTFLLARFQHWSNYSDWLEQKGGCRLYQPCDKFPEPTIIHATSKFQIFPSEENDGLRLPVVDSGIRGPYYVDRAFVGKDAILGALRFEGKQKEQYIHLLEPQL